MPQGGPGTDCVPGPPCVYGRISVGVSTLLGATDGIRLGRLMRRQAVPVRGGPALAGGWPATSPGPLGEPAGRVPGTVRTTPATRVHARQSAAPPRPAPAPERPGEDRAALRRTPAQVLTERVYPHRGGGPRFQTLHSPKNDAGGVAPIRQRYMCITPRTQSPGLRQEVNDPRPNPPRSQPTQGHPPSLLLPASPPQRSGGGGPQSQTLHNLPDDARVWPVPRSGPALPAQRAPGAARPGPSPSKRKRRGTRPRSGRTIPACGDGDTPSHAPA